MNTVLQIEVSEELSNKATEMAKQFGMSLNSFVSEAMRSFLAHEEESLPNEECYQSLLELRAGGGIRYANVQEFYKELGI